MDILISAIFQVLHAVLSIYFWIVIGRAIISWVNPDPYNPIVITSYSIHYTKLYELSCMFDLVGDIVLGDLA